jgi:ABC-type sugar transport system ATPase subunit
MQVRLGFAIASQWLTNIILLDEVLAVGDMNFRNKCFSRLSSIKSKGGSFILVSHDMHAIARVCDKCILMSEGGMYYQGDTIKSICLYEAEPSKYQNKKETIEASKLSNIYQVDLTANGKKIEHWNLGQAGEIVIFLQEDIREDLDLTYIFTGTTDSGQSVTCRGSCKLDKKYDKLTDSIVCIAKTNSIVLPPGSYSLKLGVWGKNFSLAGSVESMPIRVVSNDKVVADSTHYQDFK